MKTKNKKLTEPYKRGDYGKQIVSTLSTQLKNKFGKNFELRNVRRMMQFAEQFSNSKNFVTLSRHFDYTKWRENLFENMTVEQLIEKGKNSLLISVKSNNGGDFGYAQSPQPPLPERSRRQPKCNHYKENCCSGSGRT